MCLLFSGGHDHYTTDIAQRSTYKNEGKAEESSISVAPITSRFPWHTCTLCGQSFKDNLSLNYHLLLHSIANQHECNVCSKRFLKKITLNQHMESHFRNRPFICGICNNTFLREDTLRSHIFTHVPVRCQQTITKKTRTYVTMINNEQTTSFKYVCSICRIVCIGLKSAKFHINKHNQDKQHHIGLKYICAMCSMAFKSIGTFEKHVADHSDKDSFVCSKCESVFPSCSKLVTHCIHCHHCNCERCGEIFHDKHSLKAHLRTHTGKYPCKYCKQMFSQDNYRGHVITCAAERPYICGVCDRRFVMMDNITAHMKLHMV